MNRDDWIAILGGAVFAFLFLCTVAFAADPPKLPAGVSCAMVREKVAEHGKVYAYAWARNSGLSFDEIYRIKRTCGL